MTLGTLASVTRTYPSPPGGQVLARSRNQRSTLSMSTLQEFYETRFHKSRVSASVVAPVRSRSQAVRPPAPWSACNIVAAMQASAGKRRHWGDCRPRAQPRGTAAHGEPARGPNCHLHRAGAGPGNDALPWWLCRVRMPSHACLCWPASPCPCRSRFSPATDTASWRDFTAACVLQRRPMPIPTRSVEEVHALGRHDPAAD